MVLKKAILCMSPTGAKMISDANLGQYVPKIFSDFIFTPMPVEGAGFEFYDAQLSVFRADRFTGYGYYGSQIYLDNFRSIFERLERFDAIELWLEPSLNSHIHVFQILTILEKMPNLARKLYINHTAEVVAGMNERLLMAAKDNQVQTTRQTFDEASIYWTAYRSGTPEKLVGLINKKSGTFPFFQKILKRFVLQLPLEPTGLRLVDRQILKYVNQGMDKAVLVLGNLLADQFGDVQVLTETAFWDAIFALAVANDPAIEGLPLEPFKYSSGAKNDLAKRKACFASEPKLTRFGAALLAGNGRWADDNKVDYWWGGTRITNDNHWSFDPATETIIAPNQ